MTDEGAAALRRELDARLRAGEYSVVLTEASAFWTESAPSHPDSPWVAVLACRASGAEGQWHEAVKWARRGLGAAPDPEASGWLHFLLGTALMYAGDPDTAEHSLVTFQRIAAGTPSLRNLMPDGLFNTGFLYRCLNRAGRDIELFRQAAQVYSANGRLRQSLLACIEIGWSYLMADQLDQAQAELESAADRLERDGDPDLGIYLQICFALYHRLRGDLAESERICRELNTRPDATPGQKADVLWIMACNACSAGDFSRAAHLAKQAEEFAVRNWWPLQLQRIQDLRNALKVGRAGR